MPSVTVTIQDLTNGDDLEHEPLRYDGPALLELPEINYWLQRAYRARQVAGKDEGWAVEVGLRLDISLGSE
jgi:hypothetical protein